MTIDPWRATCVQVLNYVVNDVSTREEAMEIVNRSLDRWEQFVNLAAGRAANGPKQLFLFPEFALTGFPMRESAAEWIEKACIQIPGPETERLQRLAQRHGIYIGANAYETDPEWPGRYFNCSFLIGPNGDILLKYKRVNTVHSPSPHDFMDRFLDRHGIEGAFPVARTEIGNIGMFPCGEIMYPEAARVLMFRGAEVILHPTNDHGSSDLIAWESAKRTRASENMVYLISSNSGGIIGSPPSGFNYGHSKIIDFNGLTIANADGPGESTRTSAMIDIMALRRARQEVGALNRIARQRIEMYLPVYQQAHFYPPNSFADEAMDSKQRVNEIMEETMARLNASGIVLAPDR